MKQEEIIRMAREAGFAEKDAMFCAAFVANQNNLERFAALVASAEREACAKLAEMAEPYQAADLIRKRGKHERRSIEAGA